jgi:hypothetical protein
MTVEYRSFLIRLWREIDAGQAPAGEWHGEVEHIQSGRRWNLEAVEALLELISMQAHGPSLVTQKGGGLRP